MVENERYIDTADGRMDTFEAYPRADGRHPAIIFYMDAPGIREELRDMARRIAAEGYLVILPNLYYRQVQASSAEYAAAPFDERIACARHISNSLIMRDTEAILSYIDSHHRANAASIGAVGFCMSGAFVLAAAGTYPSRIRCAASVYGVSLVTEGEASPHLLADRVAGELYFACAEDDDYVPGDVIDTLEAHLAGTAVNSTIDWYPGTRHGFAFPEREKAYERASAERLWEQLFALFKRNLQPTKTSED
jgi:carboxymethylenebutenolidase